MLGERLFPRGRLNAGLCLAAPPPRRARSPRPRLRSPVLDCGVSGAGVQRCSSVLFVCAAPGPAGGRRGCWDGNKQAGPRGAKCPLTDRHNCSVHQAGFSGNREFLAAQRLR
ncbi:hypothetical protein AAFF_G00018860 [Aldrovandia affinis]|uniref:Uncharacterized protein n=1 Tax=Aldrovandia affinis TaxID=143900 RepID=A0AAD7S5K5_9TELE|nr:hypothetical protein AAFF_G00018860 [Aldrovandia affinis]